MALGTSAGGGVHQVAPECAGCRRPIKDKFIYSLGHHSHNQGCQKLQQVEQQQRRQDMSPEMKPNTNSGSNNTNSTSNGTTITTMSSTQENSASSENGNTDSTTASATAENMQQHQQQSWHESCLKCCECAHALLDRCYARNERLYCRRDYYRLFGAVRCARCQYGVAPHDYVQRVSLTSTAVSNCNGSTTNVVLNTSSLSSSSSPSQVTNTDGGTNSNSNKSSNSDKQRELVYHIECFQCSHCYKLIEAGEQLFVTPDRRLLCKSDFHNSNPLNYNNKNSTSKMMQHHHHQHYNNSNNNNEAGTDLDTCQRSPMSTYQALESNNERKSNTLLSSHTQMNSVPPLTTCDTLNTQLTTATPPKRVRTSRAKSSHSHPTEQVLRNATNIAINQLSKSTNGDAAAIELHTATSIGDLQQLASSTALASAKYQSSTTKQTSLSCSNNKQQRSHANNHQDLSARSQQQVLIGTTKSSNSVNSTANAAKRRAIARDLHDLDGSGCRTMDDSAHVTTGAQSEDDVGLEDEDGAVDDADDDDDDDDDNDGDENDQNDNDMLDDEMLDDDCLDEQLDNDGFTLAADGSKKPDDHIKATRARPSKARSLIGTVKQAMQGQQQQVNSATNAFHQQQQQQSDDGQLGGASGAKRRGPRTTIKPKQLETLRTAFGYAPKPTRAQREKLAQDTGLNMRVIQVWFQNRRSKERRMKNSNVGARRQFFRGSRRATGAGAMRPHALRAPGATGTPIGAMNHASDLSPDGASGSSSPGAAAAAAAAAAGGGGASSVATTPTSATPNTNSSFMYYSDSSNPADVPFGVYAQNGYRPVPPPPPSLTQQQQQQQTTGNGQSATGEMNSAFFQQQQQQSTGTNDSPLPPGATTLTTLTSSASNCAQINNSSTSNVNGNDSPPNNNNNNNNNNNLVSSNGTAPFGTHSPHTHLVHHHHPHQLHHQHQQQQHQQQPHPHQHHHGVMEIHHHAMHHHAQHMPSEPKYTNLGGGSTPGPHLVDEHHQHTMHQQQQQQAMTHQQHPHQLQSHHHPHQQQQVPPGNDYVTITTSSRLDGGPPPGGNMMTATGQVW